MTRQRPPFDLPAPPRRQSRGAGILLAALVAVLVPATGSLAADDKPKKPETKVTQTLSQPTYKQMEMSQKAFEAKNFKGAEAALAPLRADGKYDKLNDYEKATLWNLLAAIYRAEDDNKRAIDAYLNELKQANLPEGLRNDSLFSLSQMYFLIDDYGNAIKVMNKWFAVVTDPQPDAYLLLAQAYYQQKQYAESKGPILKALAIAKQRNLPFKENWLGLLRAVYFELKDYPDATKVMETMVALYPKSSYFQQLSGLYGLQGDQRKQAEVLHAAYLGGFVTSPSDVLNLARLYMAQQVPQRAVDLMIAKMKDKTLEVTSDNLQLLAQALSLAKDNDESIPVLMKLAVMTGESRHYSYLGQAYLENADWAKAAEAFETALKAKNVANPDTLRMQLGTALYNDKKLAPARDTFRSVTASSSDYNAAATWVRFISTELDHEEKLRVKTG